MREKPSKRKLKFMWVSQKLHVARNFTCMRGDLGAMSRAAQFRPLLLCSTYDFCSTGKWNEIVISDNEILWLKHNGLNNLALVWISCVMRQTALSASLRTAHVRRQAAFWSDLETMEKWADRNVMNVDKGRWAAQQLGWNNPVQENRLGNKWKGGNPVGKDLGDLVTWWKGQRPGRQVWVWEIWNSSEEK